MRLIPSKSGRFPITVVGILGAMMLFTGCAGLFHQPSKKPTMAYMRPQTLAPKKKESQSWLGKTFAPEPEKPKTVREWMNSTKQVNPAVESSSDGE